MDRNGTTARRRILNSALRRFADGGYAATSVSDIATAARVTKPALYYHFGSKAGLYQFIVDSAHDERYRLMQEAVSKGETVREKLVEVLAVLFTFLGRNREVMRIAFATAFAAPGEVPGEVKYMPKCERNFEFVHDLIKQGQRAGELDTDFSSLELTNGIYGLMNIHVMTYLVKRDNCPDRRTARRIVDMFMSGAASRG